MSGLLEEMVQKAVAGWWSPEEGVCILQPYRSAESRLPHCQCLGSTSAIRLEIKARLEKAGSILTSTSLETLNSWLIALAEAFKQGRFDEEYDRLLSEGLDQLQQAILVLLNSQDPKEARQRIQGIVRALAQFIAEGLLSCKAWPEICHLMKEVELRLKLSFSLLQGAWTLLPFPIREALAQLGIMDAWGLISKLLSFWDTTLRFMDELLFSYDDLLQFSKAIHTLVFHFGTVLEIDLKGLAIAAQRILEILQFLDWTTAPGEPRTRRDRLEQGVGTLLVAANAVHQGWSYKGLHKDSYEAGMWWGAVLYLDRNIKGRSVVAIVHGEHCTASSCGAAGRYPRMDR